MWQMWLERMIQITVDSVNRTASVMHEGISINQRVNAISTATIRFGPLTSPLVAEGQEIVIYDSRLGNNIFGGYIKDLSYVFITDTKFYQECNCQDYAILIYDSAVALEDNTGGAFATDKLLLADLFTKFCPAITAGIYVLAPWGPAGIKWVGTTLDKCLSDIARHVYFVTPGDLYEWYVDANKQLHFYDFGGFNPEIAPFGLSDAPNNSTTFAYQFGTFEYTKAADGSERVTVVCWKPGLSAGQRIAITNSSLGWSAKTFNITSITTNDTSSDNTYALEYKITAGTLPVQQVSTQVVIPSAQLVKMSAAGNQYINSPSGNEDPASSQGNLYYNIATGKFRYYDATGWHDLKDGASFGTPSLTLATANAAGAASTAIRTDASILAFDATVPAALGTAAVGAATVAARRDHVHPIMNATTQDVTASRALATSYQNTSGKFKIITVSSSGTTDASLQALIGAASPSSIVATMLLNASSSDVCCITFCVPIGFYYQVNTAHLNQTIYDWIEWNIG